MFFWVYFIRHPRKKGEFMRVKYLKTTIRQHFPKFNERFREIGFGIEGIVFTDGKFAYKLCGFNTNYVRWLLDLRKNKLIGNPHVPEVYQIIVDKHKKDCLVKMELLYEDDDDVMWEESVKFENKFRAFRTKKHTKTKLSNYDMVAKHLADFVTRCEQSGNKICIDMHSGNVMRRHKQIVITDPVV
jgi:hypothetical protein